MALVKARQRDVDHRQQRVRQALADMAVDGSEITISSVAARARVHRSFIHRHPNLHAAVLTAANQALTTPSPASTAISHRSVLAENANLHAQNRRQACRARSTDTARPSSTSPAPSKNATKNSPPPAKPTAGSWPRTSPRAQTVRREHPVDPDSRLPHRCRRGDHHEQVRRSRSPYAVRYL